ncbi:MULTISPECIES: hypothetical protein [Streptomyces]|uniref:hypothetical protein n=1 Tax=Streptomyces TaxID=1883 RepID=UPI0004C845BA|nr:hypothetical protein [Streptomyces sp. NRRL S-1868]
MPLIPGKTLFAKKPIVLGALAVALAAALTAALLLASGHDPDEPKSFCWGRLTPRDVDRISAWRGEEYSALDSPRTDYTGYKKQNFPDCTLFQSHAHLASISVSKSLENAPWGKHGLHFRAEYNAVAPMPQGITGWTGVPDKPEYPSAQIILPKACRKPFRTGRSDVQLRVDLYGRQEDHWSDTSTRERMTHIATKVGDHLTRKYKCGDENWQKKARAAAAPSSQFDHVDPANVCRLRDLKVFTEPEAAEQVRQRTAGTIEDTWNCVTVLNKRLQQKRRADGETTLAAFTTTRNPYYVAEFKRNYGNSTSGKDFTARIVRCGSREYLLDAMYPPPDEGDAGKFGEKNLLDGDTLYADFEKAFKQRAQCAG